MPMGRIKRGWLAFIKGGLNRATAASARSGVGPFALIRTTGRKSGRTFETPLVLAPVAGGFVCELTYGDGVNWYRNLVAAARRGDDGPIGFVEHRGREHPIDRIVPVPPEAGLAAFGGVRALILRALRRREFRFLHVVGGPDPRAVRGLPPL
ncbi:nitroreductase family deazaflavin-dependent oxidoreductase [Agromyces seonyuensis]|uniref:Nitroreductase family deazaflavin-dependent oxidoreductase n=1 Tax=Agromyces seonyuensis TaxID=2662446 RepID=A0A6I4P309_9MICO|nr:nitroreductase family deazaflavin-dependent oxidoreductase [Agromyces seonyuensis]MWB98529.1 nitroreductase family deazaflavin-dependent oxidoreductase [Agromyces seonyuensis]